ncbi:hypothetical protein [Paenibacillus agilis]|uniref:Uncharacterized protein n=1 Tax=Paenibacillus agilis TaxID=3020863 RepID=A0A559IX97_9BACL|nr:hypothetical protein [Paenibacillus agilis]TVX92233.1 hypothetical protein FPZ44_03660 [Paenibacillus agilis]
MAYTRTEWKDHIVDSSTGTIIQQGTPVAALPLNNLEKGVGDAHRMLEVNETRTLAFTPGVQVIESEIDTPVTVDNVMGRTLVNLLGRTGNCEDASKFSSAQGTHSTDTTTKVNGIASIKSTVGDGHPYVNTVYDLDTTIFKRGANKKFIALADVKNGNAVKVELLFSDWKAYESTRGTSVITDRFTTVWTLIDTEKIAADSTLSRLVFQVTGAKGQYGNIDALRLYELSQAEYAAIEAMTSDKVAAKYPYVDGMTNVTNPYAIVTGGNMLPPLYSGVSSGVKVELKNDYEVKITTTTKLQWYSIAGIQVQPNTDYTLSVEHDGRISVYGVTSKESLVPNTTSDKKVTFNTKNNAVIDVNFSNAEGFEGTFTFKNPMLTVGSEPKPFQPQKRSMWAVETELAANPVTGADADALYTGDDGLPYVLEKWEKVKDLSQMQWTGETLTYTGFKRVYSPIDNGVHYSQLVSKFDGTMLPNIGGGVMWTKGDLSQLYINGNIIISISNVDSGWGDKYTPTEEEIKAYFLGWTMYSGTAGNSPDVPANNLYNGTGTKWWVRRKGGNGRDWQNATAELPTVQATDWTPYRLQYLKAKPSVVPVEKYETGAMLTTGANVVEVGSGIVIREKAPLYGDEGYGKQINRIDRSPLRHKLKSFISIYRGAHLDTVWTIDNTLAHGNQRAYTDADEYDPTATYYTTYTMLTPTLAASFHVKAAANMRGTVAELVEHVGDVERRLSVVEIQKADAAEVLTWIKPTLINGWQQFNETYTASYTKVKGVVYFRGRLKGGSLSKVAFRLPKEFLPHENSLFVVRAYTGSVNVSCTVGVETNGDVTVYDQNGEVNLENVVFPTR